MSATYPQTAVVPGSSRPAPQPRPSAITLNKILIGVAVFFSVNAALNYATRKLQTGIKVTDPTTGRTITVPANTGDIPPYALRPAELHPGAVFREIPNQVAPLWPMDCLVDIAVTVSGSRTPRPLADTPASSIVLLERNFRLGNYSDRRAVDVTIPVPSQVRRNGTLWAHLFVSRSGAPLDPTANGWNQQDAYYFVHPLTQYLPRKTVAKTRNLLEGRTTVETPAEDPIVDTSLGPVMANYYHQNTSLAFVPDTGVMDFKTVVPAVRQFLALESTHSRDGTGANTWYYPVLFVNTFWQLRSQRMELNETVTELPLHLDLGNMASWQFKTLATLEASAREAARRAGSANPLPGTGDGSEMELIKEVLFDTNPILLAITAVVTVAHLILETLAFGSDIAHYRRKKDIVGVSVRSIVANVVMQAVILLYLMDNMQNTSWIVLGSQAVGILIEMWKITTVANVRVRRLTAQERQQKQESNLVSGLWYQLVPWRVTLEDNHRLSETEERTKEYDEIAFRYMYVAAVPLLLAYAVYSLVYDSHKSWYSFVITTLVGSVYAYGFLMMVPSLYINYRLKSVAHMPAKAMMYKSLNTFIDDLFAFTIKMPLLHRLATFRDDVIFFVYLYQRWAYRVDHSRINEFGQVSAEDGADAAPEGGTETKPKAAEIEPGHVPTVPTVPTVATATVPTVATVASGAASSTEGHVVARKAKRK